MEEEEERGGRWEGEDGARMEEEEEELSARMRVVTAFSLEFSSVYPGGA